VLDFDEVHAVRQSFGGRLDQEPQANGGGLRIDQTDDVVPMHGGRRLFGVVVTIVQRGGKKKAKYLVEFLGQASEKLPEFFG
jgi:hypothetical protein